MTAVPTLNAVEGPLLAAVADRWPGPPVSEVDRVARLLIAAWERAEGKQVNVSYVATFVDMAKVVVADREASAASRPTHTTPTS